jgi:hypothetical protein
LRASSSCCFSLTVSLVSHVLIWSLREAVKKKGML